jgi:hypothetical protein
MKQRNFNNLKNDLTIEDVDQLVAIIGNRTRLKTKNRLRSILSYGVSTIPVCGILDRLTEECGQWSYCAGQSYPDEIRTIREIILKGI